MADPTPTQIPSPAAAPISKAPSTPLSLPWWRTPPAVHGALAFLASFLLIQAAFVIHVHHDFEGKYHAPFLPAYHFGLPQVERDQGFRPVCGGKEFGWDGQFYYHMSHDPFARDPETANKHFDTPTYRYQRIGVPLMAWAAARITGRTFTTPFIYHTVQIALTAFGFGVLVGWLSSVGLSVAWSLCWLLGCGVFNSLFRGLPDAPSDAMFIAALVALYYRRLGWYSLFISLACLIREGFILVAFVVFLATAVNRYSWAGSPGLVRRAALTALPGILVVAWMAYVSWVFGKSPSSARSPGLYGAPFAAFFSCLESARMKGRVDEIRWSLSSMSVVATVLFSSILTMRRSFLCVCAAVYALLIASLGPIVWEDIGGHSKAVTAVAIFGIMLLSIDQNAIRRAALQLALLANLFVGLERNVILPLTAPGGYHEFTAAQDEIKNQSPPPAEQPPTKFDTRSKIVWVNATSEYAASVPWYLRPVHRGVLDLTVDVTNESTIPWIGRRSGAGAVVIGVQLLDGKRVVVESRAVLPKDVMPGETVRLNAAIFAGRPAARTLRIGLVQEHHHWFAELGQKDVIADVTIR